LLELIFHGRRKHTDLDAENGGAIINGSATILNDWHLAGSEGGAAAAKNARNAKKEIAKAENNNGKGKSNANGKSKANGNESTDANAVPNILEMIEENAGDDAGAESDGVDTVDPDRPAAYAVLLAEKETAKNLNCEVDEVHSLLANLERLSGTSGSNGSANGSNGSENGSSGGTNNSNTNSDASATTFGFQGYGRRSAFRLYSSFPSKVKLRFFDKGADELAEKDLFLRALVPLCRRNQGVFTVDTLKVIKELNSLYQKELKAYEREKRYEPGFRTLYDKLDYLHLKRVFQE
jgi:hypothetical protein